MRFRDLDRRQFLGRRPASDGFEMRERPGRHVAKHVQKGLRIESAPLAPSRSKARERIMSRFLKFKNRVLNIKSGIGFDVTAKVWPGDGAMEEGDAVFPATTLQCGAVKLGAVVDQDCFRDAKHRPRCIGVEEVSRSVLGQACSIHSATESPEGASIAT